MAFQTSRSNNSNVVNKTYTKQVDSKPTKARAVSFGLYDGKEGSKLVMKGSKLKEDIILKAGTTPKIFLKGGESKNGKQLPPYEIVFQAAQEEV